MISRMCELVDSARYRDRVLVRYNFFYNGYRELERTSSTHLASLPTEKGSLFEFQISGCDRQVCEDIKCDLLGVLSNKQTSTPKATQDKLPNLIRDARTMQANYNAKLSNSAAS